MLDRSDRGESRRRGTDLVRVQQTRAVSKQGRNGNGRKQHSIYLSELGPRRVVMQLKWFISTIIVAISGLIIIGAVIFASMHVEEEGGSMLGAMRRASVDAMKPRGLNTRGSGQPLAIGMKTDRLVISSKGLTTRNLIYEQVVQRRGARDFITTKPYGRVVATLATEKPEENVAIPPFNPLDLMGNNTPIARKDQTGFELTSDPRVSVRYVEVPGGFLPREDNQELSSDEAEKLVAETDAVYAESEASLSEAGGPDFGSELVTSDEALAKPEMNTTVLYKKSDEEENYDSYDRRTIVARGGESLEVLIKSTGVDVVQSGVVAEALAKVTRTKKMRAGEEIRLALTPSAVEEGSLDAAKVSLFYRGAPEVTIARSGDGSYVQNDKPVPPESGSDESPGERASVYFSTYRAAKSQGLPDDFITKFLKVHTYDVDFKQRVRAGDGFELFYDIVQDEGGSERPGELLYAAVTSGGETHGYYRFRTPDGAVDYYDDKGSNSKKFLIRTPVKNARLTSSFGYRRHPLLKTLRLHAGVDWAAPIGTPILAAGNGVIEVAGREGGYGNYVRIRHANGYKTAYGHMLRLAEGVVKSIKVRQGQVIGYLGNSGMSTGPHLHYEVLVNSRFTNPLSIKIPRSRQLQGRLLTEFRHERARIDDLMHRSPVKTRVAAVEK
ncbi:MAG: peptidoglycan DD-metalloendopeptidase family protein [Rhodomicrobium sp.]|nr:peptidoglycan DD-metalloendopeptidase family protein [Rhodomicrobium sp.]